MFLANGSFGALHGNFLFSEISKRVNAYISKNPQADIIRMGIGDVTKPLAKSVIKAMQAAVEEMANGESFRGYGPEQGYEFLRKVIADNDYKKRGIDINEQEIFISDGAKCDVGAIQELFSMSAKVAVLDPVYPVYVDTNVMAGRGGKYNETLGGYEGLIYLPCTKENGFVPDMPENAPDVLYLCYPNNPTGTTLNKAQLTQIVEYANKNGALIIYDSAYEAYIKQEDVPHSIFEIEGAKTCAVEFRSFSKTAGFTGVRCAYAVVPMDLKYKDEAGRDVSMNAMYQRRQNTRFNGVSYITQRAAEAVYSPEGMRENQEIISYYMKNAKLIKQRLSDAGYSVFGGENAPYIWLEVPNGDSWAFFDELLSTKNIVATPGAGFGKSGEGYLRMTAFASYENTLKAMDRITK